MHNEFGRPNRLSRTGLTVAAVAPLHINDDIDAHTFCIAATPSPPHMIVAQHSQVADLTTICNYPLRSF
jgi:hypothetical protein